MPSAQTLDDAFRFGLITFREKTVLQVLLEFFWYDDSKVFPSLRTISQKLQEKRPRDAEEPRGRGWGDSIRNIRRCFQQLEERFNVIFRQPRFRERVCFRRQTSNFYAVEVILGALERRLEGHRAAERWERVAQDQASAAPPQAASAAVMAGGMSGGMAAQEIFDLEITDHELQQHQDRNPDATLIPKLHVVEVPTADSSLSEGTPPPPGGGERGDVELGEENLAELAELVKAWRIGGDLLRRFRGRLGAAVRYVRHRMELAAEFPSHVPEVPNPGGYVRRLLESEADLTLTVPPAVKKLKHRRAVLSPGRPREPLTTDLPAEKLRGVLEDLAKKLAGSELAQRDEEIVRSASARVEELARKLADPVPMSAVEPLEEELSGLDEQLGKALQEGFSEEWENAKQQMWESMKRYAGQMNPGVYEETLRRGIERELRKHLGGSRARAVLPGASALRKPGERRHP